MSLLSLFSFDRLILSLLMTTCRLMPSFLQPVKVALYYHKKVNYASFKLGKACCQLGKIQKKSTSDWSTGKIKYVISGWRGAELPAMIDHSAAGAVNSNFSNMPPNIEPMLVCPPE